MLVGALDRAALVEEGDAGLDPHGGGVARGRGREHGPRPAEAVDVGARLDGAGADRGAVVLGERGDDADREAAHGEVVAEALDGDGGRFAAVDRRRAHEGDAAEAVIADRGHLAGRVGDRVQDAEPAVPGAEGVEVPSTSAPCAAVAVAKQALLLRELRVVGVVEHRAVAVAVGRGDHRDVGAGAALGRVSPRVVGGAALEGLVGLDERFGAGGVAREVVRQRDVRRDLRADEVAVGVVGAVGVAELRRGRALGPRDVFAPQPLAGDALRDVVLLDALVDARATQRGGEQDVAEVIDRIDHRREVHRAEAALDDAVVGVGRVRSRDRGRRGRVDVFPHDRRKIDRAFAAKA